MRDTYYQSSGNPVQRDRLPTTALDLEMLPPALPADKAAWLTAKELVGMTLVAILVMVFCLRRGPELFWPYDLLFALPALAVSFGLALHTRHIRWLLHPLALLAWILVFASVLTPWPVKAGIFALVGGALAWLFGLHWAAIATAAPTPRAMAHQLRQHWQLELLAVSAVGALLLALMLITDALLFKLAYAAVMLAGLVQMPPKVWLGPSWCAAWDSLVAWFTFDAEPLPGLLQSPVAPRLYRCCLALAATVMTSILLVQWPGSPLLWLFGLTQDLRDAIATAQPQHDARYLPLAWLLSLLTIFVLPLLLTFGWVLACSWRMVLEAAAHRDAVGPLPLMAEPPTPAATTATVPASGSAHNPRNIYLGRVATDGSPVLVPRDVFREHAHALGDSGSGKTALFLAPLTEQLVSGGDCSVIVIDLKADTHELLGALQVSAAETRAQHGIRLPLKCFSNQNDKATFAFNPLAQPYWKHFDLFTQTDILCGATGLNYGADYGEGYYSSANAAVLHHALKSYPHCATFHDLAEAIGAVIQSAKKRELHPDIRKAGVHVQEVMKRLAGCQPLNVTPAHGYAPEVLLQAIDLGQVFQEPQLLYFHLSATLSPAGAPEIARLVSYLLLAAATRVERKHPVFLVIDEFQRMVANNLDYMLQLARSMGVGVILANQTMEDLQKGRTNLIPAVEANCRLRQWFSVSSLQDQERLSQLSGLTVEQIRGRSRTVDGEGRVSVTASATEHVVPRLTTNDIALASDHPLRSILRISRGANYAQFGGLPVIVETAYHISQTEYDRRKSLPWPAGVGTFVPGHRPSENPQQPIGTGRPLSPTPTGPQWSTEVIGPSSQVQPASTVDLTAIEELFGKPAPTQPPLRRKRRKS